MSTTVSALQRVKMSDGTYAIVLPITTTNEVFVDIANNIKLSDTLDAITVTVNINQESAMDDLIKMSMLLSDSITKPLDLNHISIRDLKDQTTIDLSSGLFIPGSISF